MFEQTHSSNEDMSDFAEMMGRIADGAEVDNDYYTLRDKMVEADTSGDLNEVDLVAAATPERLRLVADLLWAIASVEPGNPPELSQWERISHAAITLTYSKDER